VPNKPTINMRQAQIRTTARQSRRFLNVRPAHRSKPPSALSLHTSVSHYHMSSRCSRYWCHVSTNAQWRGAADRFVPDSSNIAKVYTSCACKNYFTAPSISRPQTGENTTITKHISARYIDATIKRRGGAIIGVFFLLREK